MSVSRKDIASIQRPVHTLWSLVFMDPCVKGLGIWVVNHTSMSPLALTLLSFAVSLVSAGCFLAGAQGYGWIIAGVVLYQVSNVLDALDGMVARARPGTGSPFALAADHTLDPWRLTINLTAVAYVAMERDGEPMVLALAAVFLAAHFTDWIQPRFTAEVRANYKRNGAPDLGALDRALLTLKTKLEARGLRVVFFSVHEREVLIMGAGPLLFLESEMFLAAAILTFAFLMLRFHLDISLLRNEFRTGRAEYLGDGDNAWERGLRRGAATNE